MSAEAASRMVWPLVYGAIYDYDKFGSFYLAAALGKNEQIYLALVNIPLAFYVRKITYEREAISRTITNK